MEFCPWLGVQVDRSLCRGMLGGWLRPRGRFPACVWPGGPGPCRRGVGGLEGVGPVWALGQLVLSLGPWKADRVMKNCAA